MQTPEPSADLNRRNFAFTLATAALATASVSTEATGAAEPAAKAASEVDRIVEHIKQNHPHTKLDDAALAEIRADVEQHLARSALLSSFPLNNADEPGFSFRAYRAD